MPPNTTTTTTRTTNFYHFMNPVNTEDDESYLDDEIDTTTDKDKLIELYDEELSKTLRRIQQELLTINEQQQQQSHHHDVNDSIDYDSCCCSDDDNSQLDELFVTGATTLQHMMYVICQHPNIKIQNQWKEIIGLRFETFHYLQRSIHDNIEYLGDDTV